METKYLVAVRDGDGWLEFIEPTILQASARMDFLHATMVGAKITMTKIEWEPDEKEQDDGNNSIG